MSDFYDPDSGHNGDCSGGAGGSARATGRDGGILVITDPPPSMEFGVDTISYTTGQKFQGMSCIPHGIHFCYYSMGIGPRQGFFFHITKPSTSLTASARTAGNTGTRALVVRSYEPQNEQILPCSLLSGAYVCVSLQELMMCDCHLSNAVCDNTTHVIHIS